LESRFYKKNKKQAALIADELVRTEDLRDDLHKVMERLERDILEKMEKIPLSDETLQGDMLARIRDRVLFRIGDKACRIASEHCAQVIEKILEEPEDLENSLD
jgi:phosphate uptake regulator